MKPPRVIAVSKKQPTEKIRSLHNLGLKCFAENYLQEALLKKSQLVDLDISWHFIGQIQSKKIKDLVGNFDLIHSVTRISELEKMSLVAGEKNIQQDFLVQINIADEETKQGVKTNELQNFVDEAQKFLHLRLSGLMVFPPLCQTGEESLQWFAKGQAFFQEHQKRIGPSFKHLSMGTSGDFHLAYRKGATDLRIGESLLGSR